MIAHISKPLHAGSGASKCTPTISILTPPLSSGLFRPHYHHEWWTGHRKHKPKLISRHTFAKMSRQLWNENRPSGVPVLQVCKYFVCCMLWGIKKHRMGLAELCNHGNFQRPLPCEGRETERLPQSGGPTSGPWGMWCVLDGWFYVWYMSEGKAWRPVCLT